MNSIPSFLTSIFYHNSNFYKKFLHLMLLIFAAGISVFAFAPFYHFTALIISLSGIIFYIEAKNFKLKYYYTYFSVFYIVQLYWMFYSLHTIIKLNILIAVVCFSLMILYLVIYMHFMLLLYNKLKFIDKDHKKPYARIYNLLILLPSIWVLIEYLRGILFTGFPWCNLAYSVVSNRFFNGLFPLFGSYAVSFLIVSFIAYIVLCCTYITEYFIHKKLQLSLRVFKILSIISIIYIIIFMILAYYLYHKQYTKISSHPTTVALVQGNISLESKWHSQEYLSIYTNMLTQIPKNSSDIIVLPETAIASFEENLPNNYLDNLANMAIMLGANLVTGIPKFLTNNNNNTMYDNTTYVNTAMLLTDKNHPYYAKVHLVPYGEYIPLKFILKPFYKFINLPMVGFSGGGINQKLIQIKDQLIAFNICYENLFNSELRLFAKNASLMINLSEMIWYGNTIAKDQHLAISRARALENQRYWLQVTNTGMTAIISPFGTIQSSLAPFKRDILFGNVYGSRGNTLFQKTSNIPILTVSLLFIICTIIIKYYFKKEVKRLC